MCALLLTIGLGQLSAQKQHIKVSSFESAPTDLTASTRPVYDNAGEACATILFNVIDTAFVVEGNLGVLNKENKVGLIRIWVPIGTKRLNVMHEGKYSLLGYKIPERLVPKMSYHARIDYDDVGEIKIDTIKTEIHFYAGAGFNALSIMGPSVSFGVDINHHIIELSGIYGIKKTDNLYLYKGDNLIGDYRYRVMRGSLRYGYDIKPADWVGIMPQVGIALNRFDIDVADVPNNTNKESKYTTSASAFAALRLSFGKRVKFHVTPEYDFGVYKSKHYKLVSEYDDDLKKWTDGFGINAGLILCF